MYKADFAVFLSVVEQFAGFSAEIHVCCFVEVCCVFGIPTNL